MGTTSLHEQLQGDCAPEWKLRYRWARGIAAGLEHMHGRKDRLGRIAHGDLKAKNILIGPSGEVGGWSVCVVEGRGWGEHQTHWSGLL